MGKLGYNLQKACENLLEESKTSDKPRKTRKTFEKMTRKK